MAWIFLAMNKGKGEVDGVGALLKRDVFKEQIKLQGKKLQNVEEIVKFLKWCNHTNMY